MLDSKDLLRLYQPKNVKTLALDRQSCATRHKLRVGSAVTLIPPGATVAETGADS